MYDPRDLPPPVGSPADLEGRDASLARRRAAYGFDRISPQAVQVARAHYFGMVSFQDAMVGRVLDFLEESGQADDTIVVYTSDHGDLLGDFGCFFKSCMFDGAVKVPLIFRAPGLIPAGETRRQLVNTVDILPTLCALSGIPLPKPVDGEDLSQVLRSDESPGREYVVSQTQDTPAQKYMVRTPQHKYVYCEQGATEELYDVEEDPAERHDLAKDASRADELTRLRQMLITWCIDNSDAQMVKDGALASAPVPSGPVPFNDGGMGWRWY
jgi:choline-sulfatase